jgi:uridine kinase
MDDFFLRPEQRTADRLAEVGGNVDRERFFDEILKPLAENREITYSRFDCSTQSLCPPTMVTPGHLTVIEGAYSMHPLLAPHYDLSVFLDINREQQRERILKRNSPQFAERFFNEWIPLEQKYFSQMNIKEKCTLTITMRNGYSKY